MQQFSWVRGLGLTLHFITQPHSLVTLSSLPPLSEAPTVGQIIKAQHPLHGPKGALRTMCIISPVLIKLINTHTHPIDLCHMSH